MLGGCVTQIGIFWDSAGIYQTALGKPTSYEATVIPSACLMRLQISDGGRHGRARCHWLI